MRTLICVFLFSGLAAYQSVHAQGLDPNIYFFRPDSPQPGSGGILLETAVASLASTTPGDLMTGQIFTNDNDLVTSCLNDRDGGHSNAEATTTSISNVEGVNTLASTQISAFNTSPPGIAVAIPNHSIGGIHTGMTLVGPGAVRAGVADNYTNAYLDSSYLTQPGDEVEIVPENNFATVFKFMYFLVSSPPEVTAITSPMPPPNSPVPPLTNLLCVFDSFDFTAWAGALNLPFIQDPDDVFEQFIQRNNFLHEITIGGSNLTLMHLGGGVYTIDGLLTNDTELDAAGATAYFALKVGGVNDLIVSSEVVGMFGDGVSVQMSQATRTLSVRICNMELLNDDGPPINQWVVSGGFPNGFHQ